MFVLLWACVAAAVVSAAVERPYYDIEQAEQLFEDFILNYEKNYFSPEEKQTRFEIFKEKLTKLNERNANGGAIFAINHFTDLTEEEISQYMGFLPSFEEDGCDVITDRDINTNNAPKSLDWRANGAVTDVKNQRDCGSCFAFSTVGNIEGQHFIKTKQLQTFSVQQILDCSMSNDKCAGGVMATALNDLKQIGGLELESDYPYEAINDSCRFDESKVAVKVVGCKIYMLEDEDKLKEVLASKGPLFVGINGYRVSHYHGEIMSQTDCFDTIEQRHAVLLVGYGTESGVDYWLFKNSWGSRFGEQGYFKLTRGENTCGMMKYMIGSADL